MAQQPGGVVYDRETGQPIRSVTVTVGNLRTTTDAAGRFVLATFSSFPITISASHIGYEPASITLYAAPDTSLHLSLLPKTIGLSEVRVLGRRNSVKDSLRMREEYADQFNFKPVKPWQALTLAPVGIGINLNVLFASFSREQKQSKLLKAALIRDEREDYVDRRFTKSLIQAQTSISETDLEVFHWFFRPGYEQLLAFTDYDLLMYIRDKYTDFSTHREAYPGSVPTLIANP
ncbi:MAG TPA: carboxypeptidase-like regulatory domain-containing protein [Parapedobacter sp.]|nr:carboxypeptidase-like regulatory domain-containing protein [Parapedobacter sp.]